MKQFDKKKIGVFAFLFVLIAVFLNVLFLNSALAEEEKESSECSDENAKALADETYGISFEKKDNSVIVSVKNGTFHVSKISVDNYEAEDAVSNYTYDNLKAFNITKDTPLTITFDMNKCANTKVRIDLILAVDSYPCKAKKFTKFFETDFNVPVSEKLVANTNYNQICLAIRNGTKNVGVSNSMMKLWDSSSDALEVYKSIVDYCWNEYVSYNYEKDEVKEDIVSALQAWNNIKAMQSSTDDDDKEGGFKSEFNKAKEMAKNAGNGFYFYHSGDNQKKTKKLSCDANYDKLIDDNTYSFENKKYFYGKQESTYKVKYSYINTKGTKHDLGEKNLCTRTCEETVVVEYGPPTIAESGMCFQYKVKVTSRVKCDTKIDKSAKPPAVNYCSPVPHCDNNGGSATYHQGGPTDDFESCIKQCDGGKYSSKCSNKCYSEVYENKGKFSLSSSISKSFIQNISYTLGTPHVGEFGCGGDSGEYYYPDGQTLQYKNGYARWYCNANYDISDDNYGFFDGEGIKRHYYGESSFCTDACGFSENCGSDLYNPKDAKEARNALNEQYTVAVSQCRASATCNTTTTEFTMSADYTDKGGKDHTITYPMSKGKDVLNSKPKADGVLPSVPTLKECQKNKKCDLDTVIYDYDGCYGDARTREDFYQTEITFPGSWIRSKTSEVSFKTPSQVDGWRKENGKFCMPFDVKDVNVKWWKWYMSRIAERNSSNSNTSSYFYETDEYLRKCEDFTSSKKYASSSSSTTTTNSSAPTDNVENIRATIRKFGYLEWNFNVNCFYALYDNIENNKTDNGSNGNKETVTPDKCDTDPYNFEVRSVDLGNLFPSSDGSSKGSDPTVAGRQPGFNWTKAATLTYDKTSKLDGASTESLDHSYYVNPEKLMQKIQSRNNNIFDADKENIYLDYYFHLTPEVLGKIRNLNKTQKNYNNFYGKFLDDEASIKKYGLIVYRSNLFAHLDEGSAIIGRKYVKAVGNIGCNNDGEGQNCENSSTVE